MRQIKFRFWDVTYKTFAKTEHMIGESGFEKLRDHIPSQFTGLHDKNGKEIYEGDIVHMIDDPYVAAHEIVGAVVWDQRDCRFRVDLKQDGTSYTGLLSTDEADDRQYQVIGNIYENSELLKV